MFLRKKYILLILLLIFISIINTQFAQANGTDVQSSGNFNNSQSEVQNNYNQPVESNGDNSAPDNNDRFKSGTKTITEPLNATGKAVDIIQGLKNIFKW